MTENIIGPDDLLGFKLIPHNINLEFEFSNSGIMLRYPKLQYQVNRVDQKLIEAVKKYIRKHISVGKEDRYADKPRMDERIDAVKEQGRFKQEHNNLEIII